MKAWINERGGSWVCYWNDHDGKRRQKAFGDGEHAHLLAEQFRKKKDAELLLGIHEQATATWKELRHKYVETVHQSPATRRLTHNALDRFEELIKPGKVGNVTSETIARFTSLLRKCRGKQPGSTISAETVNKYLRHLRAVLVVAHEWGYLEKMPRFRFVKAVKKLPVYVTQEHFEAIYKACDVATEPVVAGYAPADWWRGLMVMGLMTGWRIGELLAFKRADLDLEKKAAIVRGDTSKGKRDSVISLHPYAVKHLQVLRGFGEHVFPWPHCVEYLYDHWHAIQDAAGIGTRYGFHNLRKACGTLNASRVSMATLQNVMRHQSVQTTMTFYVNPLAEQEAEVAKMFVPNVG